MLGQAFLKVLDMGRSASMIIVVICVVRILLKRFPKYISYMLWSVVFFRLLCPFTLESRISPIPSLEPMFHGYAVGEDAALPEAGGSGLPAGNHTGGTEVGAEVPGTGQILTTQARPDGNVGEGSEQAGPEGNEDKVPGQVRPDGNVGEVPGQARPEGNAGIVGVPWQELFLRYGKYVWISGVGVLFLYCAVSAVRIRRKVSVSIPLGENVYITDEEISPFVMGMFRPRIYLPGGLGGKEQEYIILHEKFHIRRLDHVVKPVAFAALCIHWFNPLVWLAFVLFGRDMEMSCDEAVIRRMGEEVRADYSASLLALSTGRRLPGMIPVDFGEGDTKGRVRNLASLRRTRKGVLAVLVAGAVILILCLAFDHRAVGLDVDGPGNGDGLISGVDNSGNGDSLYSGADGSGNGGGLLPGADDSGNGGGPLSDADDSGNGSGLLSDVNDMGGESSPYPGADGSGDGSHPLSGSDVPDDGRAASGSPEAPEPLEVSLDITEHYQTSVGNPSNLYCIDSDGVLWGSGDNQCGQLGQGTQDYEFHDGMVRIAENVIDVDYSQEGFIIYLTGDHELYGVGNSGCGALQQYGEFDWSRYVSKGHYYVSEPVLLMENVAYARCGRSDVACLTEDGAVWIWGTVYFTGHYLSHDVLYIEKPRKVLEDAVLVTGGWFNHGALLRDGTVWTWGHNGAGNCGVADTRVVGEPTMVAEDTVMVWTDRTLSFDPEPDVEDMPRAWRGELEYETGYDDISAFGGVYPASLQNTVIQKADGSYWVCGENVGQEEKLVDGVEADYYAIYTHEFHPCE